MALPMYTLASWNSGPPELANATEPLGLAPNPIDCTAMHAV